MPLRRQHFFNLIRLKTDFFLEHGVKKIGIFGSVVRFEDSDKSDIDILVVFHQGQKTFKNFVALIDFFEERMQCTVDLITKEGLSPYIGPHILKEVEYASFAS